MEERIVRKTAFITGASRGIGRVCALKLAREGWNIALAAKSVEEKPNLPGTIFTVAEEIEAVGVEALPIQCDVRDAAQVRRAAEAALERFGRVDAVINNAGALWWRPMDETPMNRYDLVMAVNARGAYAVTEALLPAMKEQRDGHVIMMSPPVDLKMVPGHIAYAISKFGMTITALGLAEEMKACNIRATALWPKTVIESYATINFGLGEPARWRKADIIADAAWEILQHPAQSNGRAVIDEDFLREAGYTDFDQYKCVEGGEPLELGSAVMAASRSELKVKD
jgi:citronellol/citronellal dehydrogenase